MRGNNMNLICKLMGHDWRYNVPSLPYKRICARCHKKHKFITSVLNWYPYDFEDKRTNSQLVKEWFRG